MYHTVLNVYCMRLIGIGSGLTRSMSMVYYHWESRLTEIAFVVGWE